MLDVVQVDQYGLSKGKSKKDSKIIMIMYEADESAEFPDEKWTVGGCHNRMSKQEVLLSHCHRGSFRNTQQTNEQTLSGFTWCTCQI